ncbi:riboflavin kinase [Leptogranulimonas caecicola]|uniref:Riboflavin biosynthesis protein n=1 Tax=Leptogranulimonas caecicola TaxID=2894156 RepID=A0AAU9CIQ4_9ACTN|nr:riboflavin kinase [Leptogranulimonas caecicola]BCV18566.1 riboflavin biosynthesis protein [Atopobiaceae bacterium P1]BDC90896.1 riboflavin biosynthesis protein [Leptogranulimonas caecicola]
MEALGSPRDALVRSLGLDCMLPAPEPCQWGWRYGQIDPRERCVLVIGAFDGVHRGHQDLIRQGARQARELGVPLVILTFDPDPSVVLGAPEPQLLLAQDRFLQLWTLGPQELRVCTFTQKLATLSPEEFLDRAVFGDGLSPCLICVGEGFALGAQGKGTVPYLSSLGKARGFRLLAQPLLSLEGAPVSATRIRQEIVSGETLEASRLLGRRPFVRGTVIRGRGQGASFGFPTANLMCAPGMALPASGVFAGFGVLDGSAWPAAINVGEPPTFKSQGLQSSQGFLEATLLGFSQDIYGDSMAIVLYERLRPSRPFDSFEELVATVRTNMDQVRERYGEGPLKLISPVR